MNTTKKFTNPLFGEVRIMTMENGQIWFVGKDATETLGYKDTKKAIQLHVDDEDKLRGQITSSGQMRNMILISESGHRGWGGVGRQMWVLTRASWGILELKCRKSLEIEFCVLILGCFFLNLHRFYIILLTNYDLYC